VEEMAPYVKSLDGNHLVTVGLEGFYGAGAHESRALNPWGIYYGTNFVPTHAAAGVDFATIHLYPDVWLWGSAAAARASFLRNWTRAHARDADLYLAKPLLVAEYGKLLSDGAASAAKSRRRFLRAVLGSVYASASGGGPLVGGAFWQLLDGGMDALRDGYEIVLAEDPRAAAIIANHSRHLAELNGQDAEEVRRRRRRNRRARSGKTHAGTSDSDALEFRVHFVSLLRQILSFFSKDSLKRPWCVNQC
jgi:mannan endo-1,4-beta-mannosidase